MGEAPTQLIYLLGATHPAISLPPGLCPPPNPLLFRVGGPDRGVDELLLGGGFKAIPPTLFPGITSGGIPFGG